MISPFELSRVVPGVDAVRPWDLVLRDSGADRPFNSGTCLVSFELCSTRPGPRGVKFASDTPCGGVNSASFSSFSNLRFNRLRRLRLFVDGLP